MSLIIIGLVFKLAYFAKINYDDINIKLSMNILNGTFKKILMNGIF